MPSIETTGLTKRYGGDVVAVEDLDLTVEDGEIFGFLGPNGAGKSTTINMLLDFVRPTEGSARVFGMDVQSESRAIRERVGVLPEGYSFDGNLTAHEYVEWTVETKGAADDPVEVLDLVGLVEDADRRVGGFSKGMRQRLAFGLALVGDPDLLILDEPSSGLDPNGIQQIRRIVRDRAANGTTVFFSSHVLSEVEAVCDRVGVMNGGQLVAIDTIDALRERAGGSARIELVCSSIPRDLDLPSIDGVEAVRFRDSRIVADVSESRAKMEVIKRVGPKTEILDVLSSNASLEELFNSFTNGGRDGADPAGGDGSDERDGTDGGRAGSRGRDGSDERDPRRGREVEA